MMYTTSMQNLNLKYLVLWAQKNLTRFKVHYSQTQIYNFIIFVYNTMYFGLVLCIPKVYTIFYMWIFFRIFLKHFKMHF
jgi:hypothetical protein